jgi:hypothetical protein
VHVESAADLDGERTKPGGLDMHTSAGISGSVPIRPRRSAPASASKKRVAAALAALCEFCGGLANGVTVSSGALTYCSVDCAHAAQGQIPGNYLG